MGDIIMAKQDLDLYFKKITEEGFTSNIWFFTKQSFDNMMNFYFELKHNFYQSLLSSH